MENKIKILAFAGSLRRGSFNRALLHTAVELAPEDAEIEIFDLEGIPLYNEDLLASMPAKVTFFKNRIKAADAILIATPEYNHSVPGVLKNALDWASRPAGDNAFKDKPAAIMSAATGMIGGARAQIDLRHTFVFLEMHAVNRPEVYITFADQKFDTNGRLTDEKARGLVKDLLTALINWTRRLQPK